MSVTRACDADGIAQAVYEILTPAGPLAFCRHHYREHNPAMARMNYPAASLTEIPVPAHRLVYGTGNGPEPMVVLT